MTLIFAETVTGALSGTGAGKNFNEGGMLKIGIKSI